VALSQESRPAVVESRGPAEASWHNYWNRCAVTDDDFALIDFRRILLEALTRELKTIGNRTSVRVLNAGCGLDPLPAYLLPESPNLDITLLDLSDTCLDRNRTYLSSRLDDNARARLHFVSGNVFSLDFAPDSFDIVYHTGVIEHFLPDDQVKILSEVARVLKDGGVYLSLNPCRQGRLYVAMKRWLERHGRWEFGPEYPVQTLKGLAAKSFGQTHHRDTENAERGVKSFQIEEKNLDFKFTAWMLTKHDSSFVVWLGNRLQGLARRPFFENLLRAVFGGYILLSRIRKLVVTER
jgi:SAM-dependent methyltransferase